jgi:hypothetical protein
MTNHNFKTQLVYFPGEYGNFVSWCFYTFSNLNKTGTIIPPGGKYGSAHDLIDFFDSGQAGFAVGHQLSNIIPTGILIVPSPDKIIEYQNNILFKIHYGDLTKMLHDSAEGKIWENRAGYCNWFASGNLAYHFIERYDKNHKGYTGNLIKISIDEFFLDPVGCITKLLVFTGFEPSSTIGELPRYVNEFKMRQLFLNRDSVLEEYFQCFLAGKSTSLNMVTFYDSVWLQSKLMEAGYTIPDGIIEWPASTDELRKLLHDGSV